METLALMNPKYRPAPGSVADRETLALSSRTLTFGRIEVPRPSVESLTSSEALLRVLGFSCNYRDRSYVALASDFLAGNPSVPAAHFGSDFVAEVVAFGDGVQRFRRGDRVVPINSYPSDGQGGVLTNSASQGWLVVDESQVAVLPDGFTLAQGATLPLGVQTAHAMIRRAGVSEDDKVLVRSGRSSTGLIVASMLNALSVETYVHSRSAWSQEEVLELSPACFVRDEDLATIKGITAVIDPFADLNLVGSLSLLQPYGRYVTCGFEQQFYNRESSPISWRALDVVQPLMEKNLTVVGNCLGDKDDLTRGFTLLSGKTLIGTDRGYSLNEREFFLRDAFERRRVFGRSALLYGSD